MIKAGDKVVLDTTKPMTVRGMEIIDEVQTVCAIVGEEYTRLPFLLCPSKLWANKEGIIGNGCGTMRKLTAWEAENKY